MSTSQLAAGEQSAANLEKVVLQLKWYHQFQFAGYYAAKELGYYQDEGLEVIIQEGGPNRSPVEVVLSDNAQYGVDDSSILAARLRGEPVVVLAAIFQHSPLILMTRHDSGIVKPYDLTGQKVMITPSDVELQSMFIAEGIALEWVDFIPHTGSLDELLDGRVKAISAYITDQPNLMRQRGVEPGLLRPISYGIDFYGDSLFTLGKELQDHPERVAAFLRASLKGWEYALSHVDEIIELILTMPGVAERGITHEHLRYEAERIRDLIEPDLIDIGHINPGRWDRMAKTFAELGLVVPDYSIEGFIYVPDLPKDDRGRRVLIIVVCTVLVLAFVSLLWNFQQRRLVTKRTAQLSAEVRQRREAQETLRKSRDQLERRVQERTAELRKEITEHEQALEKLQSNHAFFRNLDRISHVMSQQTSSQVVIRNLVEEILEIYSADRAWLLFPCDPDAPSWRVPVEATCSMYPGAFNEGVEVPMESTAASVLQDALGTSDPVTYRFPEGKETPDWAQHYHIRSQMIIILCPKIGKPWLLGIHQCSHERVWSSEEKRLFRAIGERVEDALANHLLREQLEEDIVLRKRAEEEALKLLRQNRGLTQCLFGIQEAERLHLAQELHDEFGQWLTSIQADAQLITSRSKGKDPAVYLSANKIAESSATLQHAISDMVRVLRPHLLDELGLVPSLRELVDISQAHYPAIHYELSLEGDLDELEEVLNITIYRIVQEGLTNVARHSDASRVSVRLRREPHADKSQDALALTIEDDGKGIDKTVANEGYGLSGMRERVLAVGGKFETSNLSQGGFKIEVRLPIVDRDENSC